AATYGVIEIIGTGGAYIDFTAPTVDYKARLFVCECIKYIKLESRRSNHNCNATKLCQFTS
ncbi:MAG: hypothetical protein ACKPKO_38010, partial [Candidatus Fonsibacter sp.]